MDNTKIKHFIHYLQTNHRDIYENLKKEASTFTNVIVSNMDLDSIDMTDKEARINIQKKIMAITIELMFMFFSRFDVDYSNEKQLFRILDTMIDNNSDEKYKEELINNIENYLNR